ncbi:hypothetical protein FRB97_007890 [Tulasnella sp. 331]|nr:hypothetical protein FRB97_007890 [Tulasnella sp. 331]
MTFVNKCTSDVWIQPTTGAAGSCSAGCPGGSTCASNGNCYYNNPTPTSGNYRVPKGGSNQIIYPAHAGVSTAWNGNFAFCQSGTTCSQTAAVCDTSGCGTTGPYGLAEFDLSVTGTDFYDVSIIAGVSVPISITPEVVDSTNVVSGNPYACGNPGSPSPDTATLGAASWAVTPPSNAYQWVTPPSLTSLTTVSFLSIRRARATAHVLLARLAASSSSPARSRRSADTFQATGARVPTSYVPASTAQCVNNNPTWTADILPTLEFLKKACPNCYTFPYDDFSSTFTCQKTVGGFNQQNYTVTLCPSGVSFGGTGGSTPPPTTVSTGSTSTSTSTAPAGTGATCSGVSYSTSTSVKSARRVNTAALARATALQRSAAVPELLFPAPGRVPATVKALEEPRTRATVHSSAPPVPTTAVAHATALPCTDAAMEL